MRFNGDNDTTNPCYECTERHLMCHDTCEKRQVWLEERRVRKEQMKRQKDIEGIFESYSAIRKKRLSR